MSLRKVRSEAAKMVVWLRKKGYSYERIAATLAVSANSVMRWKRGITPQPGHMAALRSLYTSAREEG